jgi:hypothetical protein
MKLRVSIWITTITVSAVLATPQRLAAQGHPDCSRAKFITFDAPGAGTGHREGTFGLTINPSGAIAGDYLDANDTFHGFVRTREGAIAGGYLDANSAYHGFVRSPDGKITTFDAPGAGTGAGQGTDAVSINPAGVIAGFYIDASSVDHGFVRFPDGAIATFDGPDAILTVGYAINAAGAITGHYRDPTTISHGFVLVP